MPGVPNFCLKQTKVTLACSQFYSQCRPALTCVQTVSFRKNLAQKNFEIQQDLGVLRALLKTAFVYFYVEKIIFDPIHVKLVMFTVYFKFLFRKTMSCIWLCDC